MPHLETIRRVKQIRARNGKRLVRRVVRGVRPLVAPVIGGAAGSVFGAASGVGVFPGIVIGTTVVGVGAKVIPPVIRSELEPRRRRR